MHTTLPVRTDTYNMFTIMHYKHNNIWLLWYYCFSLFYVHKHIMRVVMGLNCCLHFVDFFIKGELCDVLPIQHSKKVWLCTEKMKWKNKSLSAHILARPTFCLTLQTSNTISTLQINQSCWIWHTYGPHKL